MDSTEFSPSVRKHIYERDEERCVYCGTIHFLGVAHIFVSRAKGGKGVKENGVLLCQRHHHDLDNGRDAEKAERIERFCKDYLTKKEGVIDVDALKIKNKWVRK